MGAYTTNGRKTGNEDRHTPAPINLGPLGHYVGVFDGHGGDKCSEFVLKNLHKVRRCRLARIRLTPR